MKSTLLKLFSVVIIATATFSCQRQTSCPAYSKIVSNPMHKKTFLSDSAPKGRY
ncbi:hypothetical protein [uncultured Pontibacter sp.]|uniref:hypothetical protein n=1 Tax=uncultured Pontibacter sp. TaxID=453356 RepID=UPI00262F3058|nr:hypothetical protein [uncultured Pontibacter sp.]